jgi:ABC-2 type transport system permease protein
MKPLKEHFIRELRRIFTDKRIVITLLGGPLLYGLLFGYIYSAGRIRGVPVVVVDQDHSELSRDLVSAVLAGENLSLAFYAGSVDEFTVAVKRDQAYACIVIPENFRRDVMRGRAGRVTVLVDGSNVLIGNVAMRTISTAIAAYRTGARSRRLLAAGMPRAAAEAAALPIHPVIRPLYNPTSHYGFFVLLGLVMAAIQQVTRMGTSIALCLEREPRNAMELKRIGGKTWLVLSAKLTATAVAVLPVSLIAMRLPFDLFGSPFRGSWLVAIALLVFFVLMQIMIGYVFAGLCRSALASLHVLLFASVPMFLLTGFTWPSYAMPQWVQALSWIIPLTHMMDMMRRMALMGTGISALWPHLALLAAWFPLAVAGSYWAFKSLLPQLSGQPPSSSSRES